MDEQFGQLIQPKPVAFSFGAPGWYVLGAFLLLLVAGVAWLVLRWWRKNGYRRQALREMKTYGGGVIALYRTNMLLKRIAMTRYGRPVTAAKRGKEWISFLNKSRGRELFGKEDVAVLERLYSSSGEFSAGFMEKAREWIQKHRYAL